MNEGIQGSVGGGNDVSSGRVLLSPAAQVLPTTDEARLYTNGQPSASSPKSRHSNRWRQIVGLISPPGVSYRRIPITSSPLVFIFLLFGLFWGPKLLVFSSYLLLGSSGLQGYSAFGKGLEKGTCVLASTWQTKTSTRPETPQHHRSK
jgi:hypothetical protein